MTAIPVGTPVVVTVRGKSIFGRVIGELATVKGVFVRVEDDLTGKLRSARPAHVAVIEAVTPPAPTV